jgi:hypothetical protein
MMRSSCEALMKIVKCSFLQDGQQQRDETGINRGLAMQGFMRMELLGGGRAASMTLFKARYFVSRWRGL